MTREVEARLKISARDATGRTFGAIAGKIGEIDKKAAAFNQRQGIMARQAQEMFGVISRYAAPAVLAYAAKDALVDFAALERQMTRIGITAGASAEQTAKAFDQVQQVSRDMSFDSVQPAIEALDTLVASGKSLEEAMAFLPSVLSTAQASGAATADIANTGLKAADALKIQTNELQRAFDIMVAGGKAGQFELKDMAQYIPGLANSFATLGYEGEDGLKKLVALLQTIREDTGDASAAATQAQNIFGKMYSEETSNKFKKFGIDLRKEMEAAKASGEDAVSAFVRLSEQAIKGDYSKLPLLFSDQEFRLGMQSLMTSAGSLERFLKIMNSAEVDGTVFRDLNVVMSDTQASIDRMASSWESLKTSLGGTIAPVAAPAMDALSSTLDRRSAIRRGLEKSGMSSVVEREAWMLKQLPLGAFSSSREADRMAMAGGYRDRQFLMDYRSGTEAAKDDAFNVPKTRDQRRALLRGADATQIGMADMGGVLIEQAGKAGDEIKSRSEEAGDRIAQGGEQAASALERVADKLLSVVSSINRLGSYAAPGGTGVNANTGRSMPPAAGRPAGTGRQ